LYDILKNYGNLYLKFELIFINVAFYAHYVFLFSLQISPKSPNDAFNFPSSLIKTKQKVRPVKPSRGTSFGSANEGADSEEALWARKCLSRASLVLVSASSKQLARHYHQRTTFSRTYLTSRFPWQMAGVWGPACFIIIGDEHEAPERSVRRMKL
jgi:hypothetical protein